MQILKYPDIRLYQLSGVVREFNTDNLATIIQQLQESLSQYPSISVLCALQIDIPARVLVFRSTQSPSKPIIMINPSIFSHKDTIDCVEECISFENLQVSTRRFKSIKIMYQNFEGEQCFYEASDKEAIDLQRGINMMFGELLIDRVDKKQKKQYDSSNAYDDIQTCPSISYREQILSLVRLTLFVQLGLLIGKFFSTFVSSMAIFNVQVLFIGLFLLFIYALVTKYETIKYKNCTSCQGANMIGNVIGYGGMLTLISMLHML